jgi:hypothetical protein
VDDELRILEVKATEVGDIDALVRYGSALARAGERKKAVDVLARAVEKDPGNRGAILALDEVAPLGLDPGSPSPGVLGSSGRSAPSSVEGPDEFSLRRVRLPGPLQNLDVTDSEGRLLAADRMNSSARPGLFRVALDGRTEEVPSSGQAPKTVCADFFLFHSSSMSVSFGRRMGDSTSSPVIPGPWACGPGHIVHCPSESCVSAIALGAAEDRWRLEGFDFVQKVAMLRGGIVLAHDRKGLHAIDLATGEHRDFLTLDGNDPGPMIASQDGRVFVMRWLPASMGPARSMIVCLGEKRELWRTNFEGNPITLAGPGESVLICETTSRARELVALSARDGRELWSVHDPGYHPPLVDARGRLYSLRHGERAQTNFVEMDPETGRELAAVALGMGVWSTPVLVAPKTAAVIVTGRPEPNEPRDEAAILEGTRRRDLLIIGPGGAPPGPGA